MAKKKDDSGYATPAKQPRDKRASFIKLAEQRVTKAVHIIKRVIPLANASNYHYQEEDAAQIVSELQQAVDSVARAFDGQQNARPTFRLHSAIPPSGNGSGG